MALHWSYNADFFSTTAGYSPETTVGVRDQIRFLIQDTQSTRPLLYDEELDFAQNQEMNAYMAAARAAETLVTRAGMIKMKKVGTLFIAYDSDFYRSLAADLRARGAMYQTVYVGGISIADKIAQEADPDWVRPRLGITTFDNPDAEQPSEVTSSNNPDYPSN